ncbi:MAG: hypothetical protein PHT33_01825 [bacterium]|nr:hypothetical protein [bacterium]
MSCRIMLKGDLQNLDIILDNARARIVNLAQDRCRLDAVTDCSWCNLLRSECLRRKITVTPCPAEEEARKLGQMPV